MNAILGEAQGLEPRRLAADLLHECREKRLTVEEALLGSRRASRLSSRDRALLVNLLLTSFRHFGEIDAVIGKLLDRPLPRKAGATSDILRIGVAQLLFLEMPPHAVIDLAVRSAKQDRNARHFSGLVNALLRKVSADGVMLRKDLDAPRVNTPPWLWERWTRAYGPELARRIAEAHAERPSLDLSFEEDALPWVGRLGGTLLPNGQIRLPANHAPVTELPGFSEGAWWVQDAAAAIPVTLFGDLSGRLALDLCAAPGGKTLQMAAAGARVTAVDVSEARLSRLAANLRRSGLEAEVKCADILGVELSGEWDSVLLDAPCSSTGTIRRHPELPWLKSEGQIAELADLQRRMLKKAATLVRPGGSLVYCTCSLEPEEGEHQVRAFLGEDSRFEIVPAAVSGLPEGALRPEGWIRTLPFMEIGGSRGLDGFFAVAMRRRP
ncbi:RsmB/NOP family class I SAM-dependent RNA methyltransferase [Aestuariivirga sp.]|uniref:RsmB/NOP family class I SAM-dependent RNA methyltransferase n=1 Tax=Aestuariivirga sp. TaxID=2650926 RepID=UPI00391D8E24